MHHTTDPAMEACIDSCLACYRICVSQAMHHCLEAGGRHVEPGHFRLMMGCAEICAASAQFMLIGLPHHRQICAQCAEICTECAESCAQLDGMEACVQACRRCADSCRQMAGAVTPRSA